MSSNPGINGRAGTPGPGTGPPGKAFTGPVVLVADNASFVMGGEAVLPLHYFRGLVRVGVPVDLVVHERVREELTDLLAPTELAHVHFVRDTPVHRALWLASRFLPARLHYFTLGFAMRLVTQLSQRRVIRRLVDRGATLIHQPTPVSPTEPSALAGLGAPVVIGPMNGGMEYPPGLGPRGDRATSIVRRAGRLVAAALNVAIPGKRRAAALLVANERTRRALPAGLAAPVLELVENGVDLAVWHAPAPPGHAEPDAPVQPSGSSPLRIVFLGRLIDWKGVDLLLDAIDGLPSTTPIELTVIGDGPQRPPLEQRAATISAAHTVRFTGWLPQGEAAAVVAASDALVLPSLLECGGAVVLEAMALGRPVVAVDWGGPHDYLDETCGVLVEPTSRPGIVAGLREALTRLSDDPAARDRLGAAGAAKVRSSYDWTRKIDRIVGIYASVAAGSVVVHPDAHDAGQQAQPAD